MGEIDARDLLFSFWLQYNYAKLYNFIKNLDVRVKVMIKHHIWHTQFDNFQNHNYHSNGIIAFLQSYIKTMVMRSLVV